jgi:hypothetical protein
VTDLFGFLQSHFAILFTLLFLASIIALTLVMTAHSDEGA